MIEKLSGYLKKKGWLVLLIILLSPNLVLFSIRLFHGNFYVAFKSVFYLIISLYLIMLPLFIFPSMKIKIYAFVLYAYILIIPLVVFCVFLYWQWPPRSVIFVLFSASKEEINEFLKGMWFLKAALIIYVLTTLILLVYFVPPKIKLSRTFRIAGISILVLLFLFFGTVKSLQNQNFSFFAAATLKRFVKETPVSLIIRSKKAIQLIKETKSTGFYKPTNFNPIRKTDFDAKEVYVLVIGESSRFDHWHRNGYYRENSPYVDTINNLVGYTTTYSNSVYTNFSVPFMFVSNSSEKDFSLDSVPTLIDYFNSAGFKTCWISNQRNQFSSIGTIARRSQLFITLDCKQSICYDSKLLDELDTLINSGDSKLFIVLHQIGSHYPYHNRYPADFRKFVPDLERNKHIVYKQKNREKLINSYDNSILYSDFILGRIIHKICKLHSVSAVVYCSDHGESLFDLSNQGFGRGINNLSVEVKHVPLFVWTSEAFNEQNTVKRIALIENRNKYTGINCLFYSFLDLANFQLDDSAQKKSFFYEEYFSDTLVTREFF